MTFDRNEILEQLVKHTSEGFWFIDADAVTLEVNPAMCSILGRPAEEVIGRSVFEFVDEENLKIFRAEIAARRRGVAAGSYEIALRRADGVNIPCHNNAISIFDRNGERIGSIGLWSDLSKLKDAERALRAANRTLEKRVATRTRELAEADATLRAFIDNSPAVVTIKDREGRFTYVNQLTADQYGMRREDMIGRRLDELLAGDITGDIIGHDAQVKRRNAAVTADIAGVLAGTPRAYKVTKFPIRDDTGADQGLGAIAIEVTEQKRAEAALRRTEGVLAAAMEALPLGFAAYDAEGRLELFNRRYVEMLPRSGHLLKPGLTIEELLRHSAPVVAPAAGYDDEERYIRDRLASTRKAGEVWTHRQSVGRWVTMTEHPTRGGGFISIIEDISERKEAEEALLASARQRKEALRVARLAGWEVDGEGRVLASPEFIELMKLDSGSVRLPPEELLALVHLDDRERVREEAETALAAGRRFECVHRMRTRDGETLIVRNQAELMSGPDGQAPRFVGSIQDITESETLERKLQQAQKMEAVGQLTGGIAHDFNNLPAVLQGNAELMREIGDNSGEMTSEIVRACERGAELIQRLLAFSRRQPLSPKPIDLDRLAQGMTGMLGRMLGATIEIRTRADEDLWPALADDGQVENAILNLAINARDATRCPAAAPSPLIAATPSSTATTSPPTPTSRPGTTSP